MASIGCCISTTLPNRVIDGGNRVPQPSHAALYVTASIVVTVED
jgi:hypothetical protein